MDLSALVDWINAHHYPTPRYLHSGADAGDRRFPVQEFVPGEELGTLSPDTVELLFDLNDRHANLHLDTTQDWAGYVWRTVYEGDSGWSDRMRTHSRETADLWERFERAAAPYRDVRLSDADLVHGDFHTGNVLVDDQRRVTAVDDLEYAGKGTRVQDLVTVLYYAYYDDLARRPIIHPEEVRRRVWDRALAVRGPAEVLICMVSSVCGLIEWSVRHGKPRDVDASLETGRRFLCDFAQRTP